MTRAIFEKNQLDQFLSLCKTHNGMSQPQLANLIHIERHTLNDWRRGKRLPSLEKLRELSKITDVTLPSPIEIKPDTWGASKAGYIVQQKYGCTLTHSDRVKAGTNSQQRRRENPDYYAALGCNVARTFALPIHKSKELAELVGILLGDGGIRDNQFTITLNSIKDQQYSVYVKSLIEKLFFYTPSVVKRKNCNAITITTSGVEVIRYLIEQGMHIGDKVHQQVDVPDWIKENTEYAIWCLRGLMDTDGGIFTHTYIVNGKSYSYLKTNFTNASQPLVNFVYQTLKNNGFNPDNKRPRKVWLYSQAESKKYIEVIGSSNDRLLKKFR